MNKYICSVCGFIYDEAKGLPDKGLPPGTMWQDVPADFLCPLCGASKQEFVLDAKEKSAVQPVAVPMEDASRELSNMEMSALCSNLAKACIKQFNQEDAAHYQALADWYLSIAAGVEDVPLQGLVDEDLASLYPQASRLAKETGDRGSLRILVWSEKATRMQSSLLRRMEETKGDMLKDTNVFVCDACGFIFVGDEAPDICPVCKVPAFKFHKIERGA